MENISKEIKPIPRRERAYYRRRFQHRIHSEIVALFAEEAAAGRMTKKQLAMLLEKNPAQITRWLSDPSNIESDTISDILLALEAEMDPRIVRFATIGKGNEVHPLIARIEKRSEVVQLDRKSPLPNKTFQRLDSPRTSEGSAAAKIVIIEPS